LSQSKVLKRILIAAYFLAFSILLANRVFLIFDYSFDLAGIEQVFVFYLIRVAQHLDLYTFWQEPPFANNQYSFLYFEFIGRLLPENLKGDFQSTLNIYRLARLGNIIFNLSSAYLAVLIYKSVYTPSKFAHLLVFFASFLSFQTIHFATRPDSLKSLFVLSFFYLFLQIAIQSKISLYKTSSFIFLGTLAIFTKQDALLVYAILCLFGFIYFQKKLWLKISAYSIIAILAFFALANFNYGPSFLENFLLPSQFNLSLAYFYLAIFRNYWHWFLFIILVLILLWKSNNDRLKPISLILLAWTFCTFLISLKWGAGPNYYQEIVIIASLLFVGLINEFDLRKRNGFIYLAPLLLLGLDVWFGNIKIFDSQKNLAHKSLFKDSMLISEKISNITKGNPYYLLSYEKQICNIFPQNCLFPSYESNMPELLTKSSFYYLPHPKTTFPILPEIKNMRDVQSHNESIMKNNLIFVLAKTCKDERIFDVSLNQSSLVDSSEFFYIYWKPYQVGP
jgi:hypothetical protein